MKICERWIVENDGGMVIESKRMACQERWQRHGRAGLVKRWWRRDGSGGKFCQ